MKKTLPVYLIAAALASAPTLATADYCSQGKKYNKHGYYGHPHHHRHHHPMHALKHYPPYPGPYWQGDKAYGRDHSGAQAGGETTTASQTEATSNLIDTAINAGNFNTLVEALKSAGLDKTLQGPGPYTVFAPSDEAFSRMPESIRIAITSNKEALAELLTYHVVTGEVTGSDVARLKSAETVQGSTITIDTSNGVKVDGANVVTADIRASNGIIHVIDAVMVPN